MSTLTLPPLCLLKSPPSISSLCSAKSISIKSGLKRRPSFRASAMATYRVKLIGPEGKEQEIEAPEDQPILDSAKNAGVVMPYSCRAGTCSTCVGHLASGAVDQSEGSFLSDVELQKGYVLTCVSFPRSDCVIYTHKVEELDWLDNDPTRVLSFDL